MPLKLFTLSRPTILAHSSTTRPPPSCCAKCSERSASSKRPRRSPSCAVLLNALDLYQCIEWAGTQSWSTGKVGINGISYYAMNQWTVGRVRGSADRRAGAGQFRLRPLGSATFQQVT
jgi:hypothetical protein